MEIYIMDNNVLFGGGGGYDRYEVLYMDWVPYFFLAEKLFKMSFDPDVLWTRSLLIWSQTRYRCATESGIWRGKFCLYKRLDSFL